MYVTESNAGRALYHAPVSQYIISNPWRRAAQRLDHIDKGPVKNRPAAPDGVLLTSHLFFSRVARSVKEIELVRAIQPSRPIAPFQIPEWEFISCGAEADRQWAIRLRQVDG